MNVKSKEELVNVFAETEALAWLLALDVSSMIDSFPEENGRPIHFARRGLVRAVFAQLEGTVFVYKQATLDIAAFRSVSFTNSEMAILSEHSYWLRNDGHPETKPAMIRIPENIRFLLRMFAKATGTVEIPIDLSSSGWDALHKSIRVRNRITHPKSIHAMDITDEEIDDLADVGEWFLDILGGLRPILTEALLLGEVRTASQQNV